MAIALAYFNLCLSQFVFFVKKMFTQDLLMCFLSIDLILYCLSIVRGLKNR